MQLFLFPCYKMFAFHTYSSHPESVGEFLFVCVCVYLCYQIHTVDASWCVCVSLSVSGSKSVYATLSLISLAMALAWLWSDRALEWWMGAGGLCYLGESKSSLQNGSPPPTCLHSPGLHWWGQRAYLHASLSTRKAGQLLSLTANMLPFACWPICPTPKRVKPFKEEILCPLSESNWGKKQGSAILAEQGVWRKSRSRADSNIMARRKNKGEKDTC